MISYPEVIIPVCFGLTFVVGFVLGRMDRNEKREKAAKAKREENIAKENIEMNIYVGNLPYNLTEGELQEAFGMYGEIDSAKIIKDVFTGKSKGFGFVHMSSEVEAQAAIKGLDGIELNSRRLRVNEARPLHRTYGGEETQ